MQPTLKQTIAEVLGDESLCIVDVGARGGLQKHWANISDYGTFIGFEPERVEAERLTKTARPNERYLARALHDRIGRAKLYHCVAPSRSSLYPPNEQQIRDIYGTAEPFAVARVEEIDVTTLDALLEARELPSPTFIKLDTQGCELDILRGASRALQGALVGVEVEAEFVPFYTGRPLFADLDAFLRGSGYQLMGFRNLYSKFDLRFWERGSMGYSGSVEFLAAWASRLIPPRGTLNANSQLLYGDAVYFRQPANYLAYARQVARPDAAITKAVLVATELHFYEYALELIEASSHETLINPSVKAALEAFVQAHSRDLAPLGRNIQAQAARLMRRLRSPGRH